MISSTEELARLIEASTPGPWRWGKEDWTDQWFLQPGVLILDGDGGGPDGVDEFDNANSALIALTPALAAEVIRLRAQVAAAEKLRAAASELHRDMMDRAQVNVDVIAGKEYRIVNAGNSAWMGFCGALDDYEAAR